MNTRIKAVLLLAPLVIFGAGCSSSAHHPPGPLGTPVILVHGYSNNTCPGSDVTRATWGGAFLGLTRVGWRGPVLPVSYYQCDKDGVDITGYGPTPPSGASASITSDPTRMHYTGDTPIDQIAHDLAWFVYDTYSRNKTPVDLVGHSMGGLIIRDALYRVASHAQLFPPDLYVTKAVTFSTPHLGYGLATSNVTVCGVASVQCTEFAKDSAFMTQLERSAPDPQGTGGTQWTVIGSSAGCDLVPATSSLGMRSAVRVDYLSPCYQHAAYLWDLSPVHDARAVVTVPGKAPVTNDHAPRSIALLVQVLMQPGG